MFWANGLAYVSLSMYLWKQYRKKILQFYHICSLPQIRLFMVKVSLNFVDHKMWERSHNYEIWGWGCWSVSDQEHKVRFIQWQLKSFIYSILTLNFHLLAKTKFSYPKYKIKYKLPQNFHFMKFCVWFSLTSNSRRQCKNLVTVGFITRLN